jgi:hypothetical protein
MGKVKSIHQKTDLSAIISAAINWNDYLGCLSSSLAGYTLQDHQGELRQQNT